MARSACIEVAADEQQRLLTIARESIAHGLANGKALEVDDAGLSGALAVQLGAFVTLTQNGTLRGCVGATDSKRALAQTVATSAFNAAFHDTRFAALTPAELDGVRIGISVLTAPEPIDADSEQELLASLRPGEDGLVLADEGRRATFLPKVWDNVSGPGEFLAHLKSKAGLPTDHWSPTLRFYRYRALDFAESEDAVPARD